MHNLLTIQHVLYLIQQLKPHLRDNSVVIKALIINCIYFNDYRSRLDNKKTPSMTFSVKTILLDIKYIDSDFI